MPDGYEGRGGAKDGKCQNGDSENSGA